MPRYIDANKLKDGIRKRWMRDWRLASMLAYIDHVPTADVREVLHGHWRHTTYKPNRSICSLCEWETDEIDSEWLKYCPFCGAKMDEKENEQ